MLGRTQVNDTTRNVFALAGRIHYLDSISKVTLTREPAVISQTEEQDGSVDTVYLGADKLVYFTLRTCDVDSAAVEDALTRLENVQFDPVGEFRKKAAEAAAKAAEEAAKDDPNNMAKAAAAKNKTANKPAAPKPMEKPELMTSLNWRCHLLTASLYQIRLQALHLWSRNLWILPR